MPQARRPWRLVLVAAVMADCAFPPVDHGYLAWIALVPLLIAITEARRPRTAFVYGYVFGWAHWGVLIHWIGTTVAGWTDSPIGWLAWIGLAGIKAGWYGLSALLAWAIARRSRGALCVLATAGAWTVIEWLRTQSGLAMPWALVGYTQYRYLPVVQVADLAGVLGVGFLVVAANAGLAEVVLRGRAARTLAPPGSLVVAALVYGLWRLAQPIAPQATVRVAIMQPNIRTQRTMARDRWTELALYRKLAATAGGTPGTCELVLWPESVAEDVIHSADEQEAFAGIARESSAWQLVGCGYRDERGRDRNSAVLLDREGEVVDRYDKRQLVPFGEWTPGAGLLAPLDARFHFVDDNAAGTSSEPLAAGRARIGALICYESVFPALALASVSEGANMLANITNDSWAGESWALRQHFAMNVLRAVETRRSVAIAALTGVSGWVDRTGRTVTVGPYRTSSLVANLPLYEDRSPYVRWGDWLVAVCAGVLAGVLLRRPAQ